MDGVQQDDAAGVATAAAAERKMDISRGDLVARYVGADALFRKCNFANYIKTCRLLADQHMVRDSVSGGTCIICHVCRMCRMYRVCHV